MAISELVGTLAAAEHFNLGTPDADNTSGTFGGWALDCWGASGKRHAVVFASGGGASAIGTNQCMRTVREAQDGGASTRASHALTVPGDATQIDVSFWFRLDALTGDAELAGVTPDIIRLDTASGNKMRLEIFRKTNTTVWGHYYKLIVTNGSASDEVWFPSDASLPIPRHGVIIPGQWHHVRWLTSGWPTSVTSRLWIDGTPCVWNSGKAAASLTSTALGTSVLPSTIYVGGMASYPSSGTYAWDFSFDDVRVLAGTAGDTLPFVQAFLGGIATPQPDGSVRVMSYWQTPCGMAQLMYGTSPALGANTLTALTVALDGGRTADFTIPADYIAGLPAGTRVYWQMYATNAAEVFVTQVQSFKTDPGAAATVRVGLVGDIQDYVYRGEAAKVLRAADPDLVATVGDTFDITRFGSPVSGVTAGSPSTVTCPGHPFRTGDQVRLINLTGGCVGLEGVTAAVTKTGTDTFTLPVDTTGQGNATSGIAVFEAWWTQEADGLYRARWEAMARGVQTIAGSLQTAQCLPLLGNHELDADNVTWSWALSHAPYPGPCYSYEFGPVHVACVAPRYYSSVLDGSGGPHDINVLDWLEHDLAAARRPWRVVMLHFPGFGNRNTALSMRPLTGREALHAVLKAGGAQLCVSAHINVWNYYVTDGVAYATVNCIDDTGDTGMGVNKPDGSYAPRRGSMRADIGTPGGIALLDATPEALKLSYISRRTGQPIWTGKLRRA